MAHRTTRRQVSASIVVTHRISLSIESHPFETFPRRHRNESFLDRVFEFTRLFERVMPADQATSRLNSTASFSTADTYANAILRTLSSLKAPSSATSYFASRQHRRTYPRTTTVSPSVVNEVSGIKACMHTCPYVLSSSSRSYFQVEVDGWSNLPQLPVLLSLSLSPSLLCMCARLHFLHALRRSPYECSTVMSSRWDVTI